MESNGAGVLPPWHNVYILAFFVSFICVFDARAAELTGKTKDLISVLQSDAAFFEKARACQQLGEIGTADAVPVLAGLLDDPKLSAYARSGLEEIPDPSAAAALREAAGKLKGLQLAGVVNSLGALRDVNATGLLAKLASDPSSGVVKEALLALGNIATAESIAPIEHLLKNGPETELPDAAAAALLAADRERASGNLERARVLYDLIRHAKVPTAYVVGATRGAILTRNTDRVTFLIEQLHSADPAIRNAALLTVREIPDDALANALNREVVSAAAERQPSLLLAIADCHNSDSIPAVARLSGSPNSEVRKIALTVLGRLGPGAAPALLTALQNEQNPDEKAIVLAGLRGLEGTGIDDLLVKALVSASQPSLRIDLIRLVDSRGASQAAPEILKQATGTDKDVSVAALSCLRSLAGANELPALITLAKSAEDLAVSEAAENALAGVCLRVGDRASESVLAELTQATKSVERNRWMRVLTQVGYAKALPIIESAANDRDRTVAENAVVQLGHWPNPAPIESLLKLMDSSPEPELRQRAVVSIVELATTATEEAQASETTITKWMERVNPVVGSVEEKRKVLAVLGRLKTTGSFSLLRAYLDDAALQTEAAVAIVQIAPALAQCEIAAEVKTALEKISSDIGTIELRAQARKLAADVVAPAAPVSLFDGHSLSGWDGDEKVWRVRDGVIVGGSLDGNRQNEFLATARSYTNFLLRLEYKLVGTEGFVNSGVQFRSVRMTNPPNEMNGYQADIGAGYSGCLYDESRRNKFLVQANPEAVKRLEKANDWNQYEIRAEGRHIQIRLNGEQTVDYTEPDTSLPQWGLIGLQIHGGNKAEVSFRNITIQEF